MDAGFLTLKMHDRTNLYQKSITGLTEKKYVAVFNSP